MGQITHLCWLLIETVSYTHLDVYKRQVYRNLLFFQQNGTIQSVGVVNGQERFDAVTTPHLSLIHI